MELYYESRCSAGSHFRGRVSPRQARYFSCSCKQSTQKNTPLLPMSLRFASGKLGAPSQGGAAELAARLCRSAQTCCGKSVHETAVSCGTAVRPGLCAPSHGQKGKAGTEYLPCAGCAVSEPYLQAIDTCRFVTFRPTQITSQQHLKQSPPSITNQATPTSPHPARPVPGAVRLQTAAWPIPARNPPAPGTGLGGRAAAPAPARRGCESH